MAEITQELATKMIFSLFLPEEFVNKYLKVSSDFSCLSAEILIVEEGSFDDVYYEISYDLDRNVLCVDEYDGVSFCASVFHEHVMLDDSLSVNKCKEKLLDLIQDLLNTAKEHFTEEVERIKKQLETHDNQLKNVDSALSLLKNTELETLST